MPRSSQRPDVYSRVTIGGRTVLPPAVRERLGVKPGDNLRYRMTETGVLIDKAPSDRTACPFAVFSEWADLADEKAYADL